MDDPPYPAAGARVKEKKIDKAKFDGILMVYKTDEERRSI
jgi:hypothetical protein